MIETYSLAPAFAAGALLGVLFFGGLWYTVEKGVASPRPALWFLGSQLLRTGVVLACFYLIARGHWERLLASFLGFLIARVIATRLAARPRYVPQKEARHAPYP